jgi:hypothetical protein
MSVTISAIVDSQRLSHFDGIVVGGAFGTFADASSSFPAFEIEILSSIDRKKIEQKNNSGTLAQNWWFGNCPTRWAGGKTRKIQCFQDWSGWPPFLGVKLAITPHTPKPAPG